MGVASKLQKIPRQQPLLSATPTLSAESDFKTNDALTGTPPEPRARHTALIPTRWGLCGVGWTEYASPTESPFLSDPRTALLSRIITPGLIAPRLRRALAAATPGATEVLPDRYGHFHTQVVPSWFGELVGLLQGYFTNAMYPLSLETDYCHWTYWKPRLDVRLLTPFQERVLNTVAGIPRGEILTYGQVAARAGNPKAARAVGAALRTNPWPILIPCHRVIGSSGHLTGFTAPGGLAAKRRLLDLEKDPLNRDDLITAAQLACR